MGCKESASTASQSSMPNITRPTIERPIRLQHDTRTDSELVSAWVGGDNAAFAAVYDRYADLLFSFALSKLRNRAEAGDVVQDTFLRASTRIAQLRDPSRLRSWLYAIARNRVMDSVRRPVQYVDAQEFAEMPSDTMEPAEAVSRAELSELVWLAAEGLNDRDRELLGLHLRHGLEGSDLADVVGMTPSQVYVAVNRLKERMAKAVGALLIARHGSSECRDLATLLRGWDGTFSLEVRSKVTRHVDSCDVCRRTRATLVAPANFSAGIFLLPIAVPAALRDIVLNRLATPADDVRSVDGTGGWRRDGFPVARRRTDVRRAGMLVAAGLAVVAILAGVVAVIATSSDERELVDASAETDVVTTAPTAPTTTTTSTTIAPVATTASTTTVPSVPPSVQSVAEEMGDSPRPTIAVAAGAGTGSTDAPQASSPAPPATSAPPVAAPPVANPPTTSKPPTVAPPPASTAPPVATTAPPAPTASTPPATTAPPPPPPPPPAAPGRVVVLTGSIDLGASQAGGTIRVRNDGGQPVSWSAASTVAAFGVSPSSGTLAAGQEANPTVSVDRSALAEGTHTTVVAISSPGGGGNVTVTARVERAPVIASFNRTPPVIRTSRSCGTTLTNVVVVVDDESGIAKVDVLWSSDGTFAQRTTLTPDATGRVFTGQIGSFSKVGSNTLTAQAVDTRGNSATRTATVTVVAC